MKALIRWIIFLTVGLPFQGLVYVLYPLIWLYWRLFIYEGFNKMDKKVALHEQIPESVGKSYTWLGLLDNPDDHGALTMYGAIGTAAMSELVDPKGNFVRRVPAFSGDVYNKKRVSGDVVISWCFAATASGFLARDLYMAAKQYLKNLGTLSYDDRNNGDVSNRCNNFGINYCPDSQVLSLGQPCAAPQFYTSSCLFALAAKHSLKWKLVFWAHWILMGGWYWCWFPIVYTNKKKMFYVRDMTMKALYVHKYVFGNRWWIRKPMETITYELSEYRNDLWYAMLGYSPIYPLPESMDAFFSQEEDATSRLTNRVNGYLGPSIYELAKQARKLNEK